MLGRERDFPVPKFIRDRDLGNDYILRNTKWGRGRGLRFVSLHIKNFDVQNKSFNRVSGGGGNKNVHFRR